MQIKIIKIATFSFCFILSSCGITTPFVDSRREAGKNYMIGESNIDTAAICYNSLFVKPDELKKMANEECNKTNRTAKFKMQKNFACTFFQPTKAFFSCIEDNDKNEPDTDVYEQESSFVDPNFELSPNNDFDSSFTFHDDEININEEVYHQ